VPIAHAHVSKHKGTIAKIAFMGFIFGP